jgi:hypothetical protein
LGVVDRLNNVDFLINEAEKHMEVIYLRPGGDIEEF